MTKIAFISFTLQRYAFLIENENRKRGFLHYIKNKVKFLLQG
ncbi:hypothetical protein PI172_2337 [Prevotella intermedia]|uniref:Uncharacterized protein n=1 Tax=Prevotella intermedia TaxID=28131 RepID=A0AAD1BMH9_PREIN|nr:hypothetical protein PI172_2337 [Prevotella intermedia]